MAISAYVGLQGSGKTYETLTGPIFTALLLGRRVVTNIAGLKADLIYDYLETLSGGVDVGELVFFDNEQVLKPRFFCTDDANLPSLVLPGDLVVIDECWRFWENSKKLSDEHQEFFRMHRHYIDAKTGISCDLIILTQDIALISRSVRGVVESTFRMRKHKALGLSSRYVVECFAMARLTKSNLLSSVQRKYNKKFFPFYSSYNGVGGKEVATDERLNIFKGSAVWTYGVLLLVLVCAAIFGFNRFFVSKTPDSSALSSAKKEDVFVSPKSANVAVVKPAHVEALSSKIRLLGNFSSVGKSFAVFVDDLGRVRLESPSVVSGSGYNQRSTIEGENVTLFSGAGQISSTSAQKSSFSTGN